VCHGNTTGRRDACDGLRGGLRITAVDHHGGAVLRQMGRDGRSDSARTADDHGTAARQ
jgi:hypothetical protein